MRHRWFHARPLVGFVASAFLITTALPPAILAQPEPDTVETATCTLTGEWRSTRGPMTLIQRESAVASTATVTGEFSAADGRFLLDGIVDGDRLELQWYAQADSAEPLGTAQLAVADDCAALTGTYRTGSTGPLDQDWVARRIAVPEEAISALLDSVAVQPRSYAQALEKLDSLFDDLADVRDSFGPERFDPALLLAELGSNAADIHAFVSTQIRYEPYRGSLRGVHGTLVAEAGNAVDQAVLAADLLRRAGYETRFARARLDTATAEALVAQLFQPRGPLQTTDVTGELLTVVSERLELDPQQARTFTDGIAAAIASDGDAAREAGRETATWLRAQVADAVASTPATTLAALHAEATDHVWVQFRGALGNWIDVDPSAAWLDHGDALAEPETFTAELDPAAQHRLTITVSIRRYDGPSASPAFVDEVLLSHDIALADVAGEALRLGNVTRNSPWTVSDHRVSANLDGINAFAPVLQVGESFEHGRAFDLSGRTTDNLGGAGLGIEEAFQGPTDILGNLFEETPTGPASVLTGYWIDIAVFRPFETEPASTYSRALLEPETVTAWSPAGPTTVPVTEQPDPDAIKMRLLEAIDIQPMTGGVAPDWAAITEFNDLLAHRQMWRAVAAQGWGETPDATASDIPPSSPTPALVGYLADRSWIARELEAAIDSDLRSFQATPGLLLLRQRPFLNAQGTVGMARSFDIADNPIHVVTPDDDGAAAAQFSLALGVLETRLERMTSGPQDAEHRGADLFLAEARAAGAPFARLDPGDDGLAQLASLDLPPAIATDLETELRNGHIVVLPTSQVTPERLAWWRVDPRTGGALGVMPGLGGQDMAEEEELIVILTDAQYDALFATQIFWRDFLVAIASVIVCMVGATSADTTMGWAAVDVVACSVAAYIGWGGYKVAVVLAILALVTIVTP